MPKTNSERSHGPKCPKNTLPPPKRIVNRSLPQPITPYRKEERTEKKVEKNKKTLKPQKEKTSPKSPSQKKVVSETSQPTTHPKVGTFNDAPRSRQFRVLPRTRTILRTVIRTLSLK